ncbi:MAG TPA: Gfo/Idh/MocA family oxidoreductase [Armatimonadota bacterium]|nr:Gfo/Idh/MocA family oxidoreductase [Armatimonadota bacterium]
MHKIRIGQIGIGHNHAEGKMNAVRNFPDVFEVIGVAEPDEQWIAARGNLDVYQGTTFMGVDELLAEKPDAVLVETDVWKLLPVAQRCIDAGVHIHMDKPAGDDINAYATLLHAAQRQQLTVQLGYMYRYNPALQRCRDAVQRGELGEIFAINAEMNTQHSAEYRTWLRHFPGGTMYIFGCHLIDLIVSMLGKPDRVVPFNKQTGYDGVVTTDNCFAVLEYPNAIAKVTTASVEVNGWGRRQFVVCGRKGTMEIKPLELPTVMTRSTVDTASNAYADCKEIIHVPETERLHRYDAMMLDFAEMIHGEQVNPFTYDHELLVQQTVLAACGYPID